MCPLEYARICRLNEVHRRLPSFIARQANPLATELSFQDTVLFNQMIDHLLLMPVHPARKDGEEEFPGLEDSVYAGGFSHFQTPVAACWVIRHAQDRTSPRP